MGVRESALHGSGLVGCLPPLTLCSPPWHITFHQSSLESSTSMIRSPGLGQESAGGRGWHVGQEGPARPASQQS